MSSVGAALRHLNAQGLDAGAVRAALQHATASPTPTQRSRGPPRADPQASAPKSVSFSGKDQLRNTTPEFVGTRSSRYDIRARRRAAEQREQRLAESAAERAAAGGPDERAAALTGGPKDWWKHQQWAVGNERQASQQAWRIERRESKLRPLASQPPFGKSAAAFSLDPVFDPQSRGLVNTLSRELGTTESFAATLIHKPRRRNTKGTLQLAPTKSLPDLAAAGQGLRFIEAVNAIRSGLGLGKDLTPQEVVHQGCVELGVEWRPEAATLKHSTWLLCEELGIATGWDEAELRTMRASEVHPSWVAPTPAPAPSAYESGSAVSLASASSNDSEKLQKLRTEAREAVGSYSIAKNIAREAVGSYAKAATAKIKKQAARELGMTHAQATDLDLAGSASSMETVASAQQQEQQHQRTDRPNSAARRRGQARRSGEAGSGSINISQPAVATAAAASDGPQWIDGFSEALNRAAEGDGRPVFVTTRPETLKGRSAPRAGAGESFAFRPSFILPQTRVLIKQPSVIDEGDERRQQQQQHDGAFSPQPR